MKGAFRQLILRPGTSAVVILMLALGIGATAAIFSVFDHFLLQPLPVPQPERLVNLTEPAARGGKPGHIECVSQNLCGYEYLFSYPMFRDLEAQQSVFTGIAAHTGLRVDLAYGERTHSARGVLVSGGYFRVLNLEPALGRLIGPQDEPRAGESAVVVLSYDYWLRAFGGDPAVVGKKLVVNGSPLTIIGVAPADFHGTTIGSRPQVFVPLTLFRLTSPRNEDDRHAYWLQLFARMKPGVTVEQASAAINAAHRGILAGAQAPRNASIADGRLRQRTIALEPGARGQSPVPRATAQPLRLLLGTALVVLLIVCVNITNLLLARGAARSGEMAVRASVGASRGHLLRQLLAELGLLAALGAMFSVPVAGATLGIVRAIIPAELGNRLSIGFDPAATIFAVAICLLTVLVVGVVPALRTTRTNLGLLLKGQASQSSGSRGVARLRSGLVTAQIAFSMVLLVLAGLFAQSLLNVARVDLGMDVDSVTSFRVSPGLDAYSPARATALYGQMEKQLAAQPGVTDVGSAWMPLLTDSTDMLPVSLHGFKPPPGTEAVSRFNIVGSHFFDTLSIPLLRGRSFTQADRRGSPRVAVVNENFVRRFDLGDGALGRHFSTPLSGDVEIVGVVADAKFASVKTKPPPQLFVPRRQFKYFPSMSFYVRSALDPDALARMIRGVVGRLDSHLPISDLTTMRQQVRENTYLDRLITVLSAAFAMLATVLAAIGLYGVTAYSVTQRSHEFGLRIALGADAGSLRMMVLKQIGLLGLAGGLSGLIAALATGRLTQSMLFGLRAYDPFVFGAALIVLSVVVAIAGYLPARLASNADPMEALRYE